jgi:serine/threonine-protein kinase SRPK3
MPCIDDLPEDEVSEKLGKPEIGYVQRKDGKALGLGVPEYIVRLAVYWPKPFSSLPSIKIVNFGESFLQSSAPQTLHTPLPVRAPEIIFRDHLDHRVDLWSLGCIVGRIIEIFNLLRIFLTGVIAF